MIYGLLGWVLFLILWPLLLLSPKLRAGWPQRLGIRLPPASAAPTLWAHAASLGDVQSLRPTLARLRSKLPSWRFVLTVTTSSGRAAALQAERDGLVDVSTYAPFDLPGVVHRFVSRLSPRLLLLEYAELWPCTIHTLAALGVPIVLHNGRLSGTRGFRLLWVVTGNLLESLSLLLMRSPRDAERALSLGARPDATHATGNTKHDGLVPVPAAHRAEGLVWICGCTHAGEEKKLLEVYARLRAQFPALRLIIVPRYPERGPEVTRLCGSAPDITVVTSVGVLRSLYAEADVAFVGGSFVRRGGQNVLEPAICGVPTLFGPSMRNFEEEAECLMISGAGMVHTWAELHDRLSELLANPELCTRVGQAQASWARSQGGAAERNAALIVQLLGRYESSSVNPSLASL